MMNHDLTMIQYNHDPIRIKLTIKSWFFMMTSSFHLAKRVDGAWFYHDVIMVNNQDKIMIFSWSKHGVIMIRSWSYHDKLLILSLEHHDKILSGPVGYNFCWAYFPTQFVFESGPINYTWCVMSSRYVASVRCGNQAWVSGVITQVRHIVNLWPPFIVRSLAELPVQLWKIVD